MSVAKSATMEAYALHAYKHEMTNAVYFVTTVNYDCKTFKPVTHLAML